MTDFNEQIIGEFRENGGRVSTAGFGDNLVVLHSIGARSGEVRLNPLFALREDDSWLVVGSAAGSPKDPAWVHNLRAHPRIEMEVPGATPGTDEVRTVEVDVSEIDADGSDPSAWTQRWDRFTAASSGFLDYLTTAEGRRFPIFRLTPVS